MQKHTTTSTSINVVGGGELQDEWHQQRGAARKISFSSTLSLGPAGMMLAFAEELINRALFREVEAKHSLVVGGVSRFFFWFSLMGNGKTKHHEM